MPLPKRISGGALRSIAVFSRTAVGARVVKSIFKRDLAIDAVASAPDDLFGKVPVDARPLVGRAPRTLADDDLPLPSRPWSGTSETLVESFRLGKSTPRAALERVLTLADDLAKRSPTMTPIHERADVAALRREADASTERYKNGASLGRFDGVPTLIKEQMAVRGLVRGAGSTFENSAPQTFDSTCVERLRAAGAIVVGSTPMTEYGMSPLGFNPKRAMPRNPHNTGHLAGGSSTGTAVAVALGLVPFAIGADGGGSIRIPSSFNGVFGIKPTWGRVSRYGEAGGGTVAHVGPIASSTFDLARVLDTIAGADPNDVQTSLAPSQTPGSFVRALRRSVRGLRIAIHEGDFQEADPAIAAACQEALRALEKEGAKLVDVRVPIFKYAAPIGYLTIGPEDLSTKRRAFRENRADYNPDLQVTYSAISELTYWELFDAKRLRQGLREALARMFCDVDILALPTTTRTAPAATDAEMASGFLDSGALSSVCRFNFLANLTGAPAMSVPIARDAANLPIGLQIVGDAWDEECLLSVSSHMERIGAAAVIRPDVSCEPAP